jgi:glycerol-3-phosphate O-acyltransferase
MSRDRWNPFTRARVLGDRKLWGEVQSGLLKPAAEMDRKGLLKNVIDHYAEEIGGFFDPGIYEIATHAVPWGFSWMLNAASVRRFLPWGMTQSLQSRIRILGEVQALQKLAEKGTILLVPTHQSNLDSLLVGYVIYLMSLPPFAYGAGLNLFSNPFLSFFMSRLGAYTVDRNKNNEIYRQTLKNYSAQILKEGIHSIFFPGGGRSRSGAIESHLKLGLLGTGLEAQLESMMEGGRRPKVFVVPMAVSYHCVLEARSLIENYLGEAGKHRFIPVSDESWKIRNVFGFFWKVFASQSNVTVRVGRALDIFGNFVDDEGQSIASNGLKIDPGSWLTSCGELKKNPQRDHEYTRNLGERLADRFHKENTVLTSHLVAFSYFELLRTRYPDFDLFRFLRLSLAQRSLPRADFIEAAERFHQRLIQLAQNGDLHLSQELQSTSDSNVWVRDGIKQLGLFHETKVIRVSERTIWTEDMNLLYYYRNRLAGYGLSRLVDLSGRKSHFGQSDPQGFLA